MVRGDTMQNVINLSRYKGMISCYIVAHDNIEYNLCFYSTRAYRYITQSKSGNVYATPRRQLAKTNAINLTAWQKIDDCRSHNNIELCEPYNDAMHDFNIKNIMDIINAISKTKYKYYHFTS